MSACSRTEAEAKAAGLRACKRCRPDLYYRGEDENVALFEGLAARVRGSPEDFADASALAKAAGVSLTKLGDLYPRSCPSGAGAWLRRERVRAAARIAAGRQRQGGRYRLWRGL